jgi:hypothetical protein
MAQYVAYAFPLASMRLGRLGIVHQSRENPVGGNLAGAEGATAPVNSQAQGTVLVVTLWRVVQTRPPKG